MGYRINLGVIESTHSCTPLTTHVILWRDHIFLRLKAKHFLSSVAFVLSQYSYHEFEALMVSMIPSATAGLIDDGPIYASNILGIFDAMRKWSSRKVFHVQLFIILQPDEAREIIKDDIYHFRL